MALGTMLGLVSKSALVGLHSWLLDAMEGPTPVSALLHSATLVCAGVVLLARLLPVLGGALGLSSGLLVLGCTSVLLAAYLGLWFSDAKRVVAYSTMVHVALMVCGLVCAYRCSAAGL